MHTEEQAKTLWCPFVRCLEGSPPGGAGVNRSGPLQSFNCITSQCSAWRWKDDDAYHPSRRRGYCGLAGQPS